MSDTTDEMESNKSKETGRILIENKTKGKIKIALGVTIMIIGFLILLKWFIFGFLVFMVGIGLYADGKMRHWYWNG